ncbi:MAG: flagellar motor switch protein FliN [Gammaproteobacteria bacterium]|nr:MAG: flagellar motor switch protein FliN [Gammaproteobacteria bacterium]
MSEDQTNEPTATPQAAQNQTVDAEMNALPGINNLDVVLNIPVDVSLELGRATVDLQNLIELSQGSVIELNRLVDEPVDVLVNGKLVAKAEVVVVDNKFGARITNIVSPEKRVEKLKNKPN